MPQNSENMNALFARTKGMIWDLDNTLYHLDKVLYDACNHAAAQAAIHLGAKLSMAEAVDLSWRSFEETGMSATYFIEKHGITKEAMHDEYHRCIDVQLIGQTEALPSLMAQLDLPHALVTHASHEWADKVLRHLGLRDIFPDDHIFAYETTGFAHKARSTKPFDMALEKLGLAPEDTIVAEDLPANLKIPYDMGATTILIHHGQKPDEMPAHIMADFNNAYDFIKSVLDLKG